MKRNLTDAMQFLNEEERKELANLLIKAEGRRKKRENTHAEHQFLFLGCQCECHEEMGKRKQGKDRLPKSCMADMNAFLQMVCVFCREHGCCECLREREREGEEELPL